MCWQFIFIFFMRHINWINLTHSLALHAWHCDLSYCKPLWFVYLLLLYHRFVVYSHNLCCDGWFINLLMYWWYIFFMRHINWINLTHSLALHAWHCDLSYCKPLWFVYLLLLYHRFVVYSCNLFTCDWFAGTKTWARCLSPYLKLSQLKA